MLRILHAVPDMNSGGIENYIMNMYRNIDRNTIQFDFLVHHANRALFDNEIEELGGRIYRLPVLDNKKLLTYRKQLDNLFIQGDWPIVHGHAASLARFYLGAAEHAGVPVRIAHSHGASFLRTPKGYAKRLLFKEAKRHANVRLACSTEAGRYLFGKETFQLAKNAISSARFSFDDAARIRVRNRLGLGSDDLLVGHIGRYNLQKNHEFLVNVFAELAKVNPKARLLLVGAGEAERKVRAQVNELGLIDKVIFQSVTDEPEAFYAAMDIFVLPSLFEGLPLVGIEAQCSGLPCVFSSEITHEVAISDLAFFLPLDKGPATWAEHIANIPLRTSRKGYASCPVEHGFDCVENAKVMSRFYLGIFEKGVGSVGSLLG